MISSLSNNSSTSKMDCLGKEQVIEMFKKDLTYQQVSDELNEIYPGERGFFLPFIEHFRSKNSKTSRI